MKIIGIIVGLYYLIGLIVTVVFVILIFNRGGSLNLSQIFVIPLWPLYLRMLIIGIP